MRIALTGNPNSGKTTMYNALTEKNEKVGNRAGIGLQLGVGYSVGFLVFFFGKLFTIRNFGAFWMPILGWTIVALFAGILTVLIIRKNKQLKAEYTLNSGKKEAARV